MRAPQHMVRMMRRNDVGPVRIVLKDGPVTIPSLGGTGVSASFHLWDDMVASEFFPAKADSAFYVLTLHKEATSANEVSKVETALVRALELLVAAWPFAGGTYLAFEKRALVQAPRYQSSAEEIEAALLARDGRRRVVSSLTTGYEIVGTYLKLPLKIAVELAKAMNADYALRKLMLYHHEACARSPSWFVPLYNVRDSLRRIYDGEREAKKQLGISNGDWSDFGNFLNVDTDLRHPYVGGRRRVLSKQEVSRLYQLAHSWVRTHLVNHGLPVACP